MAKYVVKNERGEWLTWIGLWRGPWSQYKEFGGSTSSREEAFEWKRKFGGKVYRVRRVTARREREAILALMRRVCDDTAHEDRRALWAAIEMVEAMEHRRKP